MSNSERPAVVKQKQRFSVAITTEGYQTLIHNTLGDPERSKRFIASITSAVAVNPLLQDCDAGTILAGALLGESLNLSPSPQLGQYYLVPFECRVKGTDGKTLWVLDSDGNRVKDSNGKWLAVTEKKAQFVLGYKGYVQLALRSGHYSDLDVMEIKEGEYLGKDSTTGKPRFKFIEDDDVRDTLPVIGYMAFFEYLNGFHKVLYWSKKKMMHHADTYSPAYSAAAHEKIIAGEIPEKDMWKYSSYWYKNFDDMAKKTMLRQLISRWGVMSTELQTAFSQDSNIATVDDGGKIITSPEENLQLTQPEATNVVEQINLTDL
jgi:recombination protein RecT